MSSWLELRFLHKLVNLGIKSAHRDAILNLDCQLVTITCKVVLCLSASQCYLIVLLFESPCASVLSCGYSQKEQLLFVAPTKGRDAFFDQHHKIG